MNKLHLIWCSRRHCRWLSWLIAEDFSIGRPASYYQTYRSFCQGIIAPLIYLPFPYFGSSACASGQSTPSLHSIDFAVCRALRLASLPSIRADLCGPQASLSSCLSAWAAGWGHWCFPLWISFPFLGLWPGGQGWLLRRTVRGTLAELAVHFLCSCSSWPLGWSQGGSCWIPLACSWSQSAQCHSRIYPDLKYSDTLSLSCYRAESFCLWSALATCSSFPGACACSSNQIFLPLATS